MTMTIKLENPKGMRIQDLFIGNTPLDKNKRYATAFVTVQGVPKKYGANRENLDIHAIDALKQYIEKQGTVSAELKGTTQIV